MYVVWRKSPYDKNSNKKGINGCDETNDAQSPELHPSMYNITMIAFRRPHGNRFLKIFVWSWIYVF